MPAGLTPMQHASERHAATSRYAHFLPIADSSIDCFCGHEYDSKLHFKYEAHMIRQVN